MSYFLIFLGSGLGGVCRYLLSITVQRALNGWIFPLGTFSVNMLGCFVIGVLASLSDAKGMFSSDTRLFLFVGILGGFTTFSSFGYETIRLAQDGEYLFAALNAILQITIGLFLVWAGYALARLI